MCRHCRQHNGHGHDHGGESFLKGLAFGALIGGILGVLYAPTKGSETRKKLKEETDTIKDRLGPLAQEVKEKAGPVVDKIKQNINTSLEHLADEMDRQDKKTRRES